MDLTHIALIAFLYSPIQLQLHEGSHALMVKSYGHELVSYVGHPSKKDGEFYWGYIEYMPKNDRGEKAISMAPYMYDSLAFATGSSVLNKFDDGWVKEIVFTSLMLWPLINTTYNFLGANTGSDFRVLSGREKVVAGVIISGAWVKLIYEVLK